MKTARVVLLALAGAAACAAQSYPHVWGWCEKGAATINVGGIPNTPALKVQQSFPQCTVDVYLPGTTTHVTLFSNSTGTSQANPFTASTTGLWGFYVSPGVYDIRFSGAGISAPFTISSVNVPDSGNRLFVTPQMYGAMADGTTNDTGAISSALAASVSLSLPLYFPEGNYRACGVAYSGSGDVVIYGSDKYRSTILPFGGAGSCSNMLSITTTGNVVIHDLGTDMAFTGHSLTSGSNISITGPGTTNNLTPPASVTLYNLYTARSKSVGIQCAPCQNVSYTNSTSYQNYFFGISFASSGTTASPVYLHNFNVHGITSIDESFGVGLSFFLSDISITGNVFKQSSLALLQTPHAYATISGNTFDGVPDVGCAVDSQCGGLSSWQPLFLEGAADWTVGVNHIGNLSGSVQAGFYAQGSNLNIGGTPIELPLNNGHVDGLVIDSAPGGFSLLVTATSNGGSPTAGSDITVKNTKVTGVNQCHVISGANHLDVSNNQCYNAANGGYTLSKIIDGSFMNNVCDNCATNGGHPGLTIADAATRRLYVAGNLFKNNSSSSLTAGISDTTGTSPATTLITYDATNSCTGSCGSGIYIPIPTYTPTLSSCGTGSPAPVAGSTNAVGQFTAGGGTVSACTINFAGNGFATNGSTTTQCFLNDDILGGIFGVNASSGSLYTVNSGFTTPNIAGHTIRYNCSSPGGQANQGQYPYPYFWR